MNIEEIVKAAKALQEYLTFHPNLSPDELKVCEDLYRQLVEEKRVLLTKEVI